VAHVWYILWIGVPSSHCFEYAIWHYISPMVHIFFPLGVIALCSHFPWHIFRTYPNFSVV
jgi:hypothetical protein